MIRKGEAWERPAAGPPDRTIPGGDAEIAAAVRESPGVRLALEPGTGGDLARALGLGAGAPGGAPGHDLTIDAFQVQWPGRDARFGVNVWTLGTPPDRLTWASRRTRIAVVVDGRTIHEGPALAVLVANGQYLRGADVVPRGHPGDGRVEVQVYHPHRVEAGAVRRRVAVGAHLPHPRITQAAGAVVEVRAGRALPVELDGVAGDRAAEATVRVVPGRFVVVL
jgi:hypothetical protein